MTSAEIGRLIARSWSDKEFMTKLQMNPAEALEECGLNLIAGRTLHIHTNTPTEIHIVIPEPPEITHIQPKNSGTGGGCTLLACRGDNSW